MELHRDEFDLMTVIKFLSWGLKDLIEQKNITFGMNVDDVANKLLTTNRVVGDKQRIVQTLGEYCCTDLFAICTVWEVLLRLFYNFKAWKGHCSNCSGFTIYLPFYSVSREFSEQCCEIHTSWRQIRVGLAV